MTTSASVEPPTKMPAQLQIPHTTVSSHLSQLLETAADAPQNIAAIVVHISPGQGARSDQLAEHLQQHWLSGLQSLTARPRGLRELSLWWSVHGEGVPGPAGSAACGSSCRHRRLIEDAATALEGEGGAGAACGWGDVAVKSVRDGVLHLTNLAPLLRG